MAMWRVQNKTTVGEYRAAIEHRLVENFTGAGAYLQL